MTVEDVVAPVTLETGAGNIRLHLSSNANVERNLGVGIGAIGLGGFDVGGDVGSRLVEGMIEADAAVGDSVLIRQ